MKVGIVTIYDYFNHGNRLQNFALEKALGELGHEAQSLVITSKKLYVPLLAVAKCVGFIPTMRRMAHSKKFTKQNMNSKCIDFCSHKKLKELAKGFDKFVLGSDQVFNPAYMADDFVSFLKFSEAEKNLSYAASFGIEKLQEKNVARFKNGLSNFYALSVREQEGAKIVKDLIGKNAEVVVDPTMLLTKECWEREIEKAQINLPKEKYLLTYFLGTNKTYKKQAKEIAKKLGLELVSINSLTNRYHAADPMQFMKLLQNAALVCTNSFHGHALSIVMEKPFISFGAFSSTKSRIRNLLTKFDLQGRDVSKLSEKDWLKIDYSFAKEKMKEEREKGLAFLKNSLEQKNAVKSGRKIYCRKQDCTGCYACVNACPKQCISMKTDEEGFSYPKIDESQCINCNLCERVCPVKNKRKSQNETLKAYGAYSKNFDTRMKSSSGGIFSALAENVLDKGGAVFGVGLNEKFEAEHICVQTKEDLQKLRGSKYVQSKVGDSYKKAKEILESGRVVLYSGTPCQIEGLNSYLGKTYDNLITQDIICHGVPSPLVWKNYVEFRQQVANGKAEEVHFRKKVDSWKHYYVYFKFNNGKIYQKSAFADPMMRMFFMHWCLRPACHECVFKDKHRNSDITLADFWGVKKVLPKMYDRKGVSLVLTHSTKGEMFFKEIQNDIEFLEVEPEKALKYNPSMTKSSKSSFRRKRFIKDLQTKPFAKVVRRYKNKIL